MEPLVERAISIVSEGTRLEGKIVFDQISRVYGAVTGEVVGSPGSTLILCESSQIEGTIEADTLFIDGFVKGNISALKKIVISQTGRVIGNIVTPSLQIDFGAYFEGQCEMKK